MLKISYSKYHVDQSAKGKQKRTYKGILYDSYLELQFLKEWIEPKVQTGEIIKFERQVTYVLQNGFSRPNKDKILPIKYKSDFDITFADGSFKVFDTKGIPDATSLLKRKLFWSRYPNIDLIFICRNLKYGGWVPFDDLKKMKSKNNKNKKVEG